MILKWGWRVEGGAMRILLAPWKASSKRGRWRRSSNRGPFLKPSYPHCHFQHWSYQSLCPQIVKSSTFPNPPKVKHVFTSHFYFANHQTDSCMASDQMSQNGEAAAALAVPCFLSNWGRDPGAICRLGLFGACPENNTNISCRRIWWQVFNILSNLGSQHWDWFSFFFTFWIRENVFHWRDYLGGADVVNDVHIVNEMNITAFTSFTTFMLFPTA